MHCCSNVGCLPFWATPSVGSGEPCHNLPQQHPRGQGTSLPGAAKDQLPGSCQPPQGSIWNPESHHDCPQRPWEPFWPCLPSLFTSVYSLVTITTGIPSLSTLHPCSNPIPRPFLSAPETRLWSTNSPVSSMPNGPSVASWYCLLPCSPCKSRLIVDTLQPQRSCFTLLLLDHCFLKTL